MIELIIFIFLWLLTFPIAWKLLPHLILLKPKDYKLGVMGWLTLRFLYMFIIVLPYIAYLNTAGISELARMIVLSLAFITIISNLIKLFFANKIVRYLWFIYGYVYDGLLNFYPYIELQEKIANKIIREPTHKLNVVDLGCGTGNLVSQIGSNIKLEVTGVDSSSSMIRLAKRKTHKNRNIKLVKSDLMQYLKAQEPNQFDVATLVNVLYTQQDQAKFLNEVKKILKPNGILIIADPDRTGNWSLIKHHISNDSFLKLLRPRLTLVWIIDNFISVLSKNDTFVFNNEKQLLKLINESGFLAVDKTERVYGSSVDGTNLLLVSKVA